MDRILLAMILMVVVQYVLTDSCSSKTVCKDCLQEAGCQWCAAEGMWPNSAEGTRCRKRPELRDPNEEASWCSGPAGSLLDPPDHNITRPQQQQPEDFSFVIPKPADYIYPQSTVVNTRRASVELVFLVKLDVNQKELDVNLERKNKKGIYQTTPTSEYSKSMRQVGNWKLYTLKMTVNAACGSTELRFRSGVRPVPVVLNRSCECDCGRAQIDNATECGGRGVLHCGGCECGADWAGPRCETSVCLPDNRGDMSSFNGCLAPDNGLVCSGAGVCRCNRKCICNDGGDYFNEYCSDFCSMTGACALCYQLKSNRTDFYYSLPESDSAGSTEHKCKKECNGIALLSGDKRDPGSVNRVACSVVDEEDCRVVYSGWNVNDYTILRIDGRNCSAPVYSGMVVGTGGVIGAVVGAVLGVALVAAVGTVLWRAAQRPGDVLSSMEYEHMDAEFNQGENPLYKPPTSRYNNPTYQQTRK